MKILPVFYCPASAASAACDQNALGVGRRRACACGVRSSNGRRRAFPPDPPGSPSMPLKPRKEPPSRWRADGSRSRRVGLADSIGVQAATLPLVWARFCPFGGGPAAAR